jgi:two-component system nitrate/nitrite response regulator NarL
MQRRPAANNLREKLVWILATREFPLASTTCSAWQPEHQPILLTVDVGDDPKGAVAQIELLKERYPTARVAVIADYYHRNDLVAAYRAGANACFVKRMSCGAFIKTIESVINGETILPPELLPFIDDHEDQYKREPAAFNATTNGTATNGETTTDGALMNGSALSAIGIDTVPRLSTREKCILRCMVEGDSNKAIARKIEIAEATVKVHVKAILRKIRLSNRTQAAIWAMNNSALVWSADAEPPAVEGLVAPPPLAPEEQNGACRSVAVRVANGPSNLSLVRASVAARKKPAAGLTPGA